MKVLFQFFVIFLAINLLSCSARKTVKTKTMYNDYPTFRAQQKSFTSSDGAIKYTDKGNGNPNEIDDLIIDFLQ